MEQSLNITGNRDTTNAQSLTIEAAKGGHNVHSSSCRLIEEPKSDMLRTLYIPDVQEHYPNIGIKKLLSDFDLESIPNSEGQMFTGIVPQVESQTDPNGNIGHLMHSTPLSAGQMEPRLASRNGHHVAQSGACSLSSTVGCITPVQTLRAMLIKHLM